MWVLRNPETDSHTYDRRALKVLVHGLELQVKIMVRFTARAAGFVDDSSDEVLEVGFSEMLDGSVRSILINRSTADGSIEALFGMDSYCVSTEVGNSDYGGLVRVGFMSNEIELTLSDESAAIVGIDRTIDIVLDVSEEIEIQVRNGLRELLTWGRSDAIPELIGL
jgi:hypothetical protein